MTEETTVALVTGANKGIGYQTARLLGELGHNVLIGARDPEAGRRAEAALREGGADARFVPLEVTDAASIGQAAKHVEETFGRLDILVNNAGIARPPGSDGAADWAPSHAAVADVRAIFEVNVFGVIAVTNAMLPLLRRAPAARIVHVSSEVGSIGSVTDPDSPLFALTSLGYPASKAALNMVTAMYAKELAGTPIKVNAANPGYCATDLNGNSGFRTAEEGARISVELATLPADGPSGELWGYLWDPSSPVPRNGRLPW